MNTNQVMLPEHLQALQTPSLLLFERPFLANLEKMARHCKEKQLTLRPHAKTHKSSRVAAEQVKRGAVGICCATLAEAELLAGSVDSILITSPLVLDAHISRLRAIQAKVEDLVCVFDDAAVVALVERHFSADKPLGALIDLDPGMHRTGIEIGTDAYKLAHILNHSPAIDFRGIQCYAGNLMHVHESGERQQRSLSLWQRVAEFKADLEQQQISCPVVSGGGTGTHDIDWRSNTLTELQAGSYPFMDIEYADIDWMMDDALPFQHSLFVLTTVVSANVTGHATTDAGLKAFATDSVLPKVHAGIAQAAKYIFKGDEHGGLIFDDASAKIKAGTQLLVTPPHCDPTINLYDHFTVVDDDLNVIDRFDIDARSGRVFGHV